MACIKRRMSKPAFQLVLSQEKEEGDNLPVPHELPPRTMLDSCRSSIHRTSRWLNANVRKIAVKMKMLQYPDQDEVLRQGRILMQQYIYQRLKRNDLIPKHIKPPNNRSTPSDVFVEISMIGKELERLYPGLYQSITKQVNVSVASPAAVRRTYTELAEGTLEESITWAGVINLFSLASALALDCAHQGYQTNIPIVLDSFCQVLSGDLSLWIVNQGGWTDVSRAYRASTETVYIFSFGLIGILIGISTALTITA